MSGAAPLILQPLDWPETHRRRFDDLFVAGDILDDSGPAAHWSNGSRRKRTQSYGHWLGYLSRCHALDSAVDPADLLTPERIKEFIDDTKGRISLKSASMQVEDLMVLATCLSPERDWSWLKQVAGRMRRAAGSGDLKPRAPVSALQIFEWSLRRMKYASTLPASILSAQQFRDGLSVGLLISRPLRVRSFAAIDIGRHLVRAGGNYVLQFEPHDMKDRKAREFAMPTRLIAPLEEYLEQHRLVLLGGGESSRLWISTRGAALGIDSFTGNLANLTRREFGVALRPHAFRHIAATSIATVDPEHVGIIADLLGHTTLRMSEKHYNKACGVGAFRHYQSALRRVRSIPRNGTKSKANNFED